MRKALSALPGVRHVYIDYKQKKATVSIDKTNTELLVTVTPRLVNALEVDQLPEGPDFPIPFMDVDRWDETVGKKKAEPTSGGS